MTRRYIATYDYTETVRGKSRDFVHETIIEADNQSAAHRRAVNHFDDLARESSVGWTRVLNRCAIAAAPSGAVVKGGKRIYKDSELEK
jgi:hypothetical protein